MARVLLPWQRVVVVGPSMVPTLRSGDALVVRVGAPVRPGDVVLASFRTLPQRYVVKRAVRRAEGGWQVASDNPFAGGDSSVYGVADVRGRAVLLLRWGWWPRPLPEQQGGGEG